MRTWQVVAASVALALGMSACARSTQTTNAEQQQTQQPAEQQKMPTKTEQHREIVDLYVGAYNESYDPDITGINYYDPHDEECGHYRTEFRLAAWKDSVGAHGACGGCEVDVTAYKGNEVRVYAEGPTDEIEKVFANTIRMFDANVTDEQIADAIDTAENSVGGGNGITLKDSVIDPMIFSAKDGNAEIMVNCKVNATPRS